MAANRLDQLIDHWSPELQKAFLESIYRLRDRAQIEQIAKMLENGDIEAAIRAVGLDPTAFRELDKQLANAFEAGGNATARLVPAALSSEGFRLVFQFNIRNPGAENWLREHSSNLVQDILDDQRQMIRDRLVDGLQRGLNPRTTALDLVGRIGQTGNRVGGVIGLTSSQEQWVRNYEQELVDDLSAALNRELRDKRFDPAIRKAMDGGEPLSAGLRAKMVATYKNRALLFRAEAISRTETMASLHEAQQEAIRQAKNAGIIQQNAITFIWRTAGDNRVRDTHEVMDGQEVRDGESFVTGSGARLRFPGDPLGPVGEIINCRCWREPKIDFLSGVN